MFGKKKKTPKVEKVFDSSSSEEQTSSAKSAEELSEDEAKEKTTEDLVDFFGEKAVEDSNLTEAQKAKVEKLNNVKGKISKILQSQNIEIIDENIGDEYENDNVKEGGEQSQQDYDSLKALFGDKGKNKKQELTLTIDDFDYTYVGQYLEEFDLMHLKNIKRVRLQRKKNKKLRKALLIVSIVLIVGLGGFLAYYFTRETPVYLKNVTLSQTSHDYYVNEYFDYTGLYFNLEYSDGRVERVKLENKYLIDATGKVERTGENNELIQFVSGNTATLVFKYEGFEVTYTINILKKNEKGISLIYSDGLFNLKSGDSITSDYILFMINYGEYGEELGDITQSGVKLFVDGTECAKSKAGYKLTSDLTKTSKIKITYQSYEIEFSFDETTNYFTSLKK